MKECSECTCASLYQGLNPNWSRRLMPSRNGWRSAPSCVPPHLDLVRGWVCKGREADSPSTARPVANPPARALPGSHPAPCHLTQLLEVARQLADSALHLMQSNMHRPRAAAALPPAHLIPLRVRLGLCCAAVNTAILRSCAAFALGEHRLGQRLPLWAAVPA